MSPQKPTARGFRRRTDPPKSSAPQPTSSEAERPPLSELPTDFASLAHILEAAATAESSAFATEKGRRSGDNPSRDEVHARFGETSPELVAGITSRQAETGNSQQTVPSSQEPLAGDRSGGVPAATRSGETSQREAAAFDEVARSLGAAEACVPLLAQSTGLLRIAALDVVKAETARAGGLLQLLRFLRGDLTPAMTAVSTSAVVQRVVQAAESERRLRGIALTTRSSVADVALAGDETLLVNTVLALVLTTFAAIEGVQNARVMLSVTVSDSGEIGLAISQDHVAAPEAWTRRVGSDALMTDSGPVIAAIAISAAHRLVREWHGRFAVASGEHSSILTIWLPTQQVEEAERPM